LSADVDIIIVGGGAAGIAAARRVAAGKLTTLLLEAGQRLGGRAWTHEMRGLSLDLGCGWLHSADRNAWTPIAARAGIAVDRARPAWGTQYRDLGFPPADQAGARQAFAQWMQRVATAPPPGDCAADALQPGNAWNPYIRAIVGFISGARLERLSIADYLAYDEKSTDDNWRVRSGLGALICGSMPDSVRLRLATPVEAIVPTAGGVTVKTPSGDLRARAVILTVSTSVLAGGAIKLPAGLDPWREAATRVPLGRNEKLFLEIIDGAFETETQVFGDPHDARTGAYYIRPFGWPVIEGFFGGEGAELIEREGPAAGFAHAFEQLAGLFGADIRRQLKPLVISSWSGMDRIGGGYSYACPGSTIAREQLARAFEERIFFAGEATSTGDFSTVHGAHDSGVRAANEAIAAL
jgi:monoamine oxidase